MRVKKTAAAPAETTLTFENDAAMLAVELSKNGVTIPLVKIHSWSPLMLEALRAWVRGTGEKPPFLPEPRGAVAEASAPLAEEIAKNDVPAPFRGFPSAQPQSDRPRLSAPMQRIVEMTFLREDELLAAAEKLRTAIVIGAKRNDYGTVMEALDQAEENSRLAHRFMCTVKEERDRFEAGLEIVMSGMRTKANEALQWEKDNGKRSKAITDGDVESKMASLYPDEYESIRNERRRLELTSRRAENEVEIWSSRCRSLQTIASKLR